MTAPSRTCNCRLAVARFVQAAQDIVVVQTLFLVNEDCQNLKEKVGRTESHGRIIHSNLLPDSACMAMYS